MDKKQKLLTVAVLLLFLSAAVFLGSGTQRSEREAAEETNPPDSLTIHPPRETDGAWNLYSDPPQDHPLPVDDPEAPEPEIAVLLASVPLSAKTQSAIYDLCGEDDALFCAVMAIAKKESQFSAAAIGDDGKCIGMMQINWRYHTDRMNRLGVTDLTDPVQCAAVAIDYLMELEKAFMTDTDSHVLYLCYNAGPTGAKALFDKGIQFS